MYLVGLYRSLQAASIKSIVTNPYSALNIGSAYNPNYRAANTEVIEIDACMLALSLFKVRLLTLTY